VIVFKLTRPQNLLAVTRTSSPGHRIVMAVRKGYTLEDFQRSVSASSPAEYASVADPELFAFDALEIMNFLSGPQDVSMLRIGNCIFQH
jgi:hypothetical protein